MHNVALLNVLRHLPSGELVMVGNTRLFWDPFYDRVRYGQASHLFTAYQKLHDKHKGNKILPSILGGDFNSPPVSSVLSIMHQEDILSPDMDNHPSTFTVPLGTDQEVFQSYIDFSVELQPYIHEKEDDVLFKSAYANYRPGTTRDETYPAFTVYNQDFKGAYDHLFVNHRLTVKKILTIPEEADL
jgi:mRNA deadenylase 3'-5' endonuclease subunit Ccr4